MADTTGFTHSISINSGLSELDLAILVAWFLSKTNGNISTNINSIVDFLTERSIRPNVNKARLKKKLTASTQVTCKGNGDVHIPLKTAHSIKAKYSKYLGERPPEVSNTILPSEDFSDARKYVQSLTRQINGCRQFHFFDGCAVLMRRLMEVLIIDAYEKKKLRDKILYNGEYLPLSGLLGELESRNNFRPSRNAPQWMKRTKEMGDNAAHSRTYITKQMDIDDFAGSYRNLVSELMAFQDD